jgi:hypothetical protein
MIQFASRGLFDEEVTSAIYWHVFFFGGGAATPCASPPPWSSIFCQIILFGVHHLVNRDDRHLLAHATASDFLGNGIVS